MAIKNLLKELEDARRVEEILTAFLKKGFGYVLHKYDLKRIIPIHKRLMAEEDVDEDTTVSKPVRLREAFEQLGGTFIKLGQLLSLRPDLIPQEYCDEFRKLQDAVPPFSFSDVKKIISEELGKPIDKAFAEFSEKPIAAASIGQVHKAKLKNGKIVVVKIQRPNIEKLFKTDIQILHYLAKMVEKRTNIRYVKPAEIVKEFERYTLLELDFKNEGRNIDKFYNNFKQDKTRIPKVYWDFVSKRVLTMEYIKGTPLSNSTLLKRKKVNMKIVFANITDSFLKQIFIDGFFHGDPHPGNIFVVENNKIALLDFGVVGSISARMRETASALLLAVIEKDTDGITDSMVDMGFIDEEKFNRESFKADVEAELPKYHNLSLEEINFTEMFDSLIRIAKDNYVSLPSSIVLLIKAIATLESYAERIYPEFNLIVAAEPFLRDLVRKELSVANLSMFFVSRYRKIRRMLNLLPEQSYRFMQKLNRGQFKVQFEHKDLEGLVFEIERASNKLVMGAIAASLIVASALGLNISQPLIYGIPGFSLIGFVGAGVIVIMLMFSLSRAAI